VVQHSRSLIFRGAKVGKSIGRTKPRYKFHVYITSYTPASDAALAHLRRICDKNIPAGYEIEVFDLSKNPPLASDHNIVPTPVTFRTLPAPVRKSIGDLPKTDKALLGLDLLDRTAL
jgi:circadian clock protein KaiB